MKEDDVDDGNITISKAERQHSEKIVDLLLAAWLHTYPNEQFNISEADVREKFGDINTKFTSIGNFLDSVRPDSCITYLIATLGDNISGFLYATKTGGDLYISALYVHPDHQRAGVGSSLLQEGITVNQGISHAIIDVVSYNIQAITFYKKHDFVVQGLSVTPFGQFPNGIVVPEIRMIKNCVGNIENSLSVFSPS